MPEFSSLNRRKELPRCRHFLRPSQRVFCAPLICFLSPSMLQELSFSGYLIEFSHTSSQVITVPRYVNPFLSRSTEFPSTIDFFHFTSLPFSLSFSLFFLLLFLFHFSFASSLSLSLFSIPFIF
jgi:hypothetical protein